MLERPVGVSRAIFVVHSWSGALGARMALDYPQRVAGLVMLAPVAYFLNFDRSSRKPFLPVVVLRHRVGIDHLIGSPSEKEESAGGVCNGAAARERV